MRSVTDPPSVGDVVSKLRNHRLYSKVREIYVDVGGEKWNVHECIEEPVTNHITLISKLFNEYATDGSFEISLFEYPDEFIYEETTEAVAKVSRLGKIASRFGAIGRP